MKFHRIIGKIDPKVVEKCEQLISKVLLDLGLRPNSTAKNVGSGLGGDPLIFSLLFPMQHILTRNIPTASTDGRRYYWNPTFMSKKSLIGLRIIAAHEALHSIYMHPTRRGSRLPKLWNICVDYIVHHFIMQDLTARKLDPTAIFQKEMGNFATLQAYADWIKNPFQPIPGSEHWVPDDTERSLDPNDDRELTEEEKKELEKAESRIRYFFADPNLPEDLRKPEKIYDYLYNLVPKCEKCGKFGVWKNPNPAVEEEHKKHCTKHGPDECHHDCQDGSGNFDPFGFGDTVDEHMDAAESPESMAKRMADAAEAAKRMGGTIPAGLEEELGLLIKPVVRFQDFVRFKLNKIRAGGTKNDYTRFRSRPLFAGLMIPKKLTRSASFGCLIDTSGSMSKDDKVFGISQLQSLDERSEGWIVPADAQIYWNDATKLRSCNASEISRTRLVGGGGTKYAEFFKDYEAKMGRVDFLIVITDGFLIDTDIAEMINPGIDVIWLITSGSSFNAPFGRVFDLKSL